MTFFKSLGYHFKGLAFVFSKGIWQAFVFPLLAQIALFAVAGWGAFKLATWSANWLQELALPYLSDMPAWTSDAVASVFSWIFVFFMVVYLGGSVLLMLLSPLFAYLSEKVEFLRTGRKFPEGLDLFFSNLFRGLGISFYNTLFQTGITLGLMLISLAFAFIPVIGWIIAFVIQILVVIINSYYFGASMVDYALERRRFGVGESLSFCRKNRWMCIGFGLPVTLSLMLPLVGLLFAPYTAAVSATGSALMAADMDWKSSKSSKNA